MVMRKAATQAEYQKLCRQYPRSDIRISVIDASIAISSTGRVWVCRGNGFTEIRGSIHRGYRAVKVNGKPYLLHRMLLETFVGPSPTKGALACHKNDSRLDNRIENLYWGSHQDNSDDMVRNKRTLRGIKNPRAKLSPQQVKRIRSLYQSGRYLQVDLARLFGVGQTTISRVIRKANWR